MGRSSSQRSYRSISSRKERRRNIREGHDNSDSDDSSNTQSDSESNSGSEDNWEDDYHQSDSDSYYSGRGSERKQKKDEEMGFDDETTHYEDPSENSMTSPKNTKSPLSIRSSKSAKSKQKADNDEESESDSDDDSDSDSSDSDSDSDSDTEAEPPMSENELMKTKLKAIALTVLLMIFLITIIVLGAIFGIRKSKALKPEDPVITVTEAPATDPLVTAAPFAQVEVTPTLVPTLVPTAATVPTMAPVEEIITGDIPSEDDDFFNESDEVVVVDENGIPNRQSENSNGDTYVLTLANGTIVQDAEIENDKLLVQSRNSGEGGNDISDATSYALMNFNMGDVSWYEKDGALGEYTVDAYVCLEHIPRVEDEDQWGNPLYNATTGEPIRKVFSICRLKNTVTLQEEQIVLEEGKVGTGGDVETIASPSYKMPDDCIGGKIEEFFVSPNDGLVCIPVSSMVRNYQPFVRESAEETTQVENGRLRRRHLEDEGNNTVAEDVLSPSTKDIISPADETTSKNRTSNDNIFGNKNEPALDSLEPGEDTGLNPPTRDMIPSANESRNKTTAESSGPNEEGVLDPSTKDMNTPLDESRNETALETMEPNEQATFVPESTDEAVLKPFEPEEEEESLVPEARNPELSDKEAEASGETDGEPDFSATPDPTTTDGPTNSPTSLDEKSQVTSEMIVDPSNFKNMLFMIANLEDNQDASAQFYSKESEIGPYLVLDLREFAPTLSPTPDEVSDPVEVSEEGEEEYIEEGTYPPCGVCGNYKSFVPLDNTKEGIVPFDLAPALSMIARNKTDQTATARCDEWERICNRGQCSPLLCESLVELNEFCGCEEPVEEPCAICEGEEFLESPLTQVELTAEQSPNGQSATMSCSFLEGYCEAGFCNPDVCSSVQSDGLCACAAAPTMAPTPSPEPTQAPTSSPTFKAEHAPCSICGRDFADLELANVIVQIEEEIRPPQVTSGNATCTELESYCQGGYCNDLMCTSFQQASIQEACGCPIDNIFDGDEDETTDQGEDNLSR